MTKDIWAEKPELVDAYWYDLQGENLPDSYRYYINKEDYEKAIEDWLEKLKTEWDESIADCHHSLELVAKKMGEYMEKAEKLGDISSYPEIKFGSLTVLEYLDLVEVQADHYSVRAIEAEEKLEAVSDRIIKYGKVVTRPDPADLDLIEDIKKILEGKE